MNLLTFSRLVGLGLMVLMNHQAFASVKNNDVTDRLESRYEQDCEVRDQFDLYQFGRVIPELEEYTQRMKDLDEAGNTGTSVHFNKVHYHNVPIAKVEYVFLPGSKRQQRLYLDLTSATAKQYFTKINFHDKAGFNVRKEGRFAIVECTW